MSTRRALHFVKHSSRTMLIRKFTVVWAVISSFHRQISSNSLSLHARQPVAIVRLTQEDEPIINTDG